MAEDFVRRFAAYWQNPDPSALDQLLTSDVRLVQPLSATTHGLAAAQAGDVVAVGEGARRHGHGCLHVRVYPRGSLLRCRV